VLLLAVFQVGCGGKKKDSAGPAGPTVPALRFAGVNLEYALDRSPPKPAW
jgi:hypothetical protein